MKFFSWHHTAHHIIQTPRRALSQTGGCRISPPRGWGQALALLLHQNQPRLFSAQRFAWLESWPPVICPNKSLGRLC